MDKEEREITVHICTYVHTYIFLYKNTTPITDKQEKITSRTENQRVTDVNACICILVVLYLVVYDYARVVCSTFDARTQPIELRRSFVAYDVYVLSEHLLVETCCTKCLSDRCELFAVK